MKVHNERNAGRKKKYSVPTIKMIIPFILKEEVVEMSKPYLTKTK